MMRAGGFSCLLLSLATCRAFAPSAKLLQAPSCNQISLHHTSTHNLSHHERKTSLHGGLFGGSGKKEGTGKTTTTEEPDASIPTRVLEIPVSSLKRGGLRFTLGLHLVGQQDNGTWKANQANDNTLDMYFKDNSAMFSIVIGDDAITVERFGKPSLAYVLQESVLLHSVLDELNTLAFEGDIEAENRLLRLEEPGDAIEKAREKLPARKA